jgi:hypothetical protein
MHDDIGFNKPHLLRSLESSGMYSRVVTVQLTTSIIILMMEAVRTSETSVNFNVTTLRYIPEDSKLHFRRRESLKSHTLLVFVSVFMQSHTVTYLHSVFKHLLY